MKKIILVLLLIIITFTGCSIINTNKSTKTDAIIFKEEYESLNNKKTNYSDDYYRTLDIDENNPIIYKSANDIIKMIDNKETFAVYFGFADCPWCRSIISTFLEVSNDLEIDTIYYVDIKDIRDTLSLDENNNVVTTKEGSDDYYKLLEKLNNVLDDYTLTNDDGLKINTNKKRIYAPNIITIENGVATKITTGISDMQENAYMELTEEIKNDSYNMIKCTIECLKEEEAICTLDKKC